MPSPVRTAQAAFSCRTTIMVPIRYGARPAEYDPLAARRFRLLDGPTAAGCFGRRTEQGARGAAWQQLGVRQMYYNERSGLGAASRLAVPR